MRHLLAATFLVSAIASPSVHAAASCPAHPSAVPQSSQFTPLLPIDIERHEPRWRPTDQRPPRRAALVIGTNEALDSRVALKAAGPAVAKISEVLTKLGYEVEPLTGNQVRPERIRATIADLTAGMSAPGNQLLVAFVGHGYVSSSVQALATSQSSWIDGEAGAPGQLGAPLLYDDLLNWVLDSQTRVRKAGGELATALWIDACRVGTQSIGDHSLTVNERLADLQIFSAGRGKEAFVNTDTGLPYFTAEVCKHLERAFRPSGGQAGRNLVDLRASFDRALEQSESLRKQEPTWVGRKGLDRFLMYDPRHLSLTVRAVDGLTGSPIDDATLTFQGEKKSGALGTFGGRIPSAEGYQLDVHAPGYFGHHQTVSLEHVEGAMSEGKVLDVPLTQSFLAVEGVIKLTSATSGLLQVSLEGLDDPIAPVTLTGGGPFRFQAAASADLCEFVVRSGPTELFRESLSLKSLTSPRRVGGTDVQVYVREPLRLNSDRSAPVGAGEQEVTIGAVTLEFNFDSLQRTDFLDGWRTYSRVRRYAERSDFENALGQLDELGDESNLVAAARERFGNLQRELGLSVAMEEASKLQSTAREQRRSGQDREARMTMDQAIGRLHGTDMLSDVRVKPVVTSWLLVSAENWFSYKEHEKSLSQFERLAAVGYNPASLTEQRQTIAADWLGDSFRKSMRDGDWPATRKVFDRSKELGVDSSSLAEWQARIARESISPACRAAFSRAKDLHADGNREAARTAYIEALIDPSMTNGYRTTILPLVQRIEDELYQQYESTAFEKEVEDPQGALRAYLKIVNTEPSLERSIETLLGRNPELKSSQSLESYSELASWRTCVTETRRLLASEDPMGAFQRLGMAVKSGTFERETLEFLASEACSRASEQDRKRILKTQVTWEARAEEAIKKVTAAVAKEDFESAWMWLDRAAAEPRAREGLLEELRGELTEAAELAELAESRRCLDALTAAIASENHDAAERALEKAKGMPQCDRDIIERLSQLLAVKREKANRELRLRSLLDREAYARLSKNDVEELALHAQTKWPSKIAGLFYKSTERFQAGGQSHWMSIWRHGKTGLEFVLVPGGKFQMGESSRQSVHSDVKPQHWVTLDPFLIARTECTQQAWGGDNPSHFKGSKLPVETVNWMEVTNWCNSAGLQLPTEAQWEYACRSGTTGGFAYGSEFSSESARLGKGQEEGPVLVGSFKPNAFGLFDVHGNVREWCRDWYVNYEKPVDNSNGLRQGTSGFRVSRGGSFSSITYSGRSAGRGISSPGGDDTKGFRPSLDLPF